MTKKQFKARWNAPLKMYRVLYCLFGSFIICELIEKIMILFCRFMRLELLDKNILVQSLGCK